jgi:hypothetical protein
MSTPTTAIQPEFVSVMQVKPIDRYYVNSPTPSISTSISLSLTTTAIDPPEDSGPMYSPCTAHTALQISNNFDTVSDIAYGLIHTLKQRKCEHRENHKQWSREQNTQGEELEFLHTWLIDYHTTLPTKECPKGYVLNHDRHCPGFTIPIQDGMWQPTHWVKQLPNSRIAELPKENGPNEVPWVQQVYTAPYDDGDDNYMVMPMPYWLLELLKGPSVAYATLDKVVHEDGDWGLHSNIHLYQELKHHHVNKQLQLNLLQMQLKGLKQSQDATLC